MNKIKILIILLTLTAIKVNAQDTIKVSQTGGGDYFTIPQAVTAAVDGDIIYVFDGDYFETFSTNKKIHLIAQSRNVRLINPGTFSISGSSTLKGFSIETTVNVNGGVIFNNDFTNSNFSISRGSFIQNNFDSCTININSSSTPTLALANYISNAPGYGITTRYDTENFRIIANKFENCKNGAIYISKSNQNTIVSNNIFIYSNECLNIDRADNFVITNCLFVDNSGNRIITVYTSSSKDVSFYNCIFINNSSSSITNIPTSENPKGFNCFFNNTAVMPAAEGNIEQDPMFVNISAEDYRLQSGSPCIDAGSPLVNYFDLNGTRNDMGIYGGKYSWDNYHSETNGPIVIDVDLSPQIIKKGETITIKGSVIAK